MPESSPSPALPSARARAFTLIELLTVIAILGVLSGIVIGVGRRAGERGKIARTKAELAALAATLETYRRQYGEYPQTNDATVLLQALLGKKGPKGATIAARTELDLAHFTVAGGLDAFSETSAVLLDPWERPYVYTYKSPAAGWSNPGFLLYSLGPDGKDDTTLQTGGYADTSSANNLDNLYANQ